MEFKKLYDDDNQRKRVFKRLGMIFVIGFLGFIALVILINILVSTNKTSHANITLPDYSKYAGRKGMLISKNSKTVIIFSDKYTWEQMYNALKIDDKHEILNLIDQKKIVEVAKYTKVLILGYDMPLFRVRILDGKHEGQVAYVLATEFYDE